jgi:hypothetical protein
MAVYLRLFAPARQADEGFPSHGLHCSGEYALLPSWADDQDFGGGSGQTGFASLS